MKEKLTSSQVVSHVRDSHMRGKEKEKMTTDTSGRICYEQYDKSSPLGLLVRMFLESLTWHSTRCFLTWKKKDTPAKRLIFQLVPSMHHIEDQEFGLLLTPSVIMIPERSTEAMERRKQYRNSIGRKTVPPGNLAEQIKTMLLPTPQSTDIRQDIRRKEEYSEKAKKGGCANLKERIPQILFPTPSTRDYKGARKKETLELKGRNKNNSLPDVFAQIGKTSQLNPRFVAEMMSFPPDYLELPFLNTETNQ